MDTADLTHKLLVEIRDSVGAVETEMTQLRADMTAGFKQVDARGSGSTNSCIASMFG
jgi:hypothetical protein